MTTTLDPEPDGTLPGLDEEETVLFARAFARRLGLGLSISTVSWKPQAHQVPPPGDDWYGWLLLAGRGAGKTDACANYMVQHVKGPPCLPGDQPHRMAIIAPTQGDAATACYSGPSGIKAHDPSAVMASRVGGTLIEWPNGSVAKLFGANTQEDVSRLRAGGNNCLAWLEELAAWRYLQDGYDQMRFGLRIGRHPRWIGSTTPRARKLIKELDKGLVKNVVLSRATTNDNPHLPEHIREALFDAYGGTALAEQELSGRVVEQDENALWTRDQIALYRLQPEDVPPLKHIKVGVDPSGGAGEQGIVVVGKHPITVTPEAIGVFKGLTPQQMGRVVDVGFVLDDKTCRLSAEAWGARAVQAAVEWEADEIVVETNFGGDMARATIVGAADAAGVLIPVRVVTASRGKRVRAEPVGALAARGRLPHVGVFEELEDQQTTWTTDADYSPDRLDALVWAVTKLGLVPTLFTGGASMGAAAGRSLTPWARGR